MYSENAQIHNSCFFIALKTSVVWSVFVQHWKWRQPKKSREVWLVSWWLRMLRHAIKSKRPGMLSDGIILLHDNARPHTVNLVRENLRDLTGKHLNILRTTQIFPLVIFTFLATWRKTTWTSRRFHSDEDAQEWRRLWIYQRPICFYKAGIDALVSQWDKCINTSGNYFWIKQIPLSLCSGCSVLICLPLIFLVGDWNSYMLFLKALNVI